MKDQQRSTQPVQIQGKREQEHSAVQQNQSMRLPAQQWTRLLQQMGGGLLDLPAPLLEQLAEAVGNSCLAELLRQGDGSGAEIFVPESLIWENQQPIENRIETAPPALVPETDWAVIGRTWLSPTQSGDLGKGDGYG